MLFKLEKKGSIFPYNDPTMKPPQLIEKKEIILPDSLKKENIQGTVLVECLIDTLGRVKTTRIIKTSNNKLNKAALETVEAYRFLPAQQNNKKINFIMVIPIKYE